MDIGEIILAGFFTPVILFFVLGMVTHMVKSDMVIPQAMSTAMAIFLMSAIGLSGGAEAVKAIAAYPELVIVIVATAVLAMILCPFFSFSTGSILKKYAKLSTADAWAAAGHYAAVSSATLAVGVGIASAAQEAAPDQFIYAGWMPAIYPFMDSPALVTAILLGRLALIREGSGAGVKMSVKKILHHTVFGMGVWLLCTSLLIGMSGAAFSPGETERALVFFDGMFRGV
jgi:hypothetical protein